MSSFQTPTEPRRQNRRRGAVTIEASLILPLFLFFWFGIIDLGIAFFMREAVMQQVRAAARYAVVNDYDTTKIAQVLLHNDPNSALGGARLVQPSSPYHQHPVSSGRLSPRTDAWWSPSEITSGSTSRRSSRAGTWAGRLPSACRWKISPPEGRLAAANATRGGRRFYLRGVRGVAGRSPATRRFGSNGSL